MERERKWECRRGARSADSVLGILSHSWNGKNKFLLCACVCLYRSRIDRKISNYSWKWWKVDQVLINCKHCKRYQVDFSSFAKIWPCIANNLRLMNKFNKIKGFSFSTFQKCFDIWTIKMTQSKVNCFGVDVVWLIVDQSTTAQDAVTIMFSGSKPKLTTTKITENRCYRRQKEGNTRFKTNVKVKILFCVDGAKGCWRVD